MPDLLHLGPYRLLGAAPTDRGGMGAVWQALHPATGRKVAVKVLDPGPFTRGGTPYELSLARRLHHPGIIEVFDGGFVDPTTAAASGGRLHAGQPYLVMEYADGGTLANLLHNHPSWTEVHNHLRQLLHALAHAHAHDVLHLDLKPANVLLLSQPDGSQRTCLADFSVGVQIRGHGADTSRGGTTGFMAPEQLHADEGPLGPWTDLYGLGALAYALLHGAPPPPWTTGARSPFLHQPVANDLPDDALAWLCALTARRPHHRPRNAVRALATLPDPAPATRSSPRRAAALGETTQAAWPRRPDPAAPGPRPTPLPSAWQPPHPPRPSTLVGRANEQDALWTLLREVADTGRSQLVALTGQPGSGRRTLARWLARAAAERGGCEPVYLSAARSLRGAEPLIGWLERQLGVSGAQASGQHVAEAALDAVGMTDPYERDIVRWMLGQQLGPEPTAAERYAVIRHFLAAVAGGAPIVAVLEEPGADPRTLAYVTAHLRHPDAPPTLWLLVHDADAACPADARALPLPPLPDRHVHELLHHAHQVHGRLAARVAALALGIPGRALQIAEHWLRDGQTVTDDAGVDLAPTADALPPSSLVARWRHKLDRALALAGPDTAEATLLAAAWGPGMPERAWTELCHILHLRDDAADHLLRHELLQPAPGGWFFADPLLWQAAQARFFDHPRWREVHLACARWREAHSSRATDLDLVAQHLLHAAQPGPAARAALTAAERHLQASDYVAAEASLDLARRATGPTHDPAQAAPPNDPELTWSHDKLRLRAWYGQSRHDEVAAEADRLVRRAHADGTTHHLPTALRFRAMVLRSKDPTLAEALFVWAADEAERHHDLPELARALQHRANLVGKAWRLPTARTMATEAIGLFEQLGDTHGAADATVELATMDRAAAPAQTEAAVRRAAQSYRDLGNRYGLARCANLLAELLRHRGALDEAEQAYRESLAITEAIDSNQRSVPMVNLGLLALERGQPDRHLLEQALHTARHDHQREVPAYAAAALLSLAADDDDWAAWERYDAVVRERLSAGASPDEELGRLLHRAAAAATARGQAARVWWGS